MLLDSFINILRQKNTDIKPTFCISAEQESLFFPPSSKFPVKWWIRITWNSNSGTWNMLNNEELTGVLLSESSPTCLVIFCPWPDADQIIGSRPSIGQRRRRPLHFSSRLMQPDGRRKRRRWGRSLHTNPSLITVRAPLTGPSRPDNEFVRWVIHAEVKRCGRSPFYLAALMDERRADFSLSEHSNNKTPPFWGRLFFLSFFFWCSSFRNLQHRRLCSPLVLWAPVVPPPHFLMPSTALLPVGQNISDCLRFTKVSLSWWKKFFFVKKKHQRRQKT